jgi:tetratricopeptide (TPR) repeat protein
MNLAVLYNSQGRNEEAEALLRGVLEDYPENHEAQYSLALLLVETGREGEALAYLEQAADGLPERARIRYNLGLLQQQLGRLADAERSMRAAVEVEPRNLDYLYALADHYARRGDFRRALAVADQMIATNPGAQVGHDMKAALEQAIAQSGGD